MEEKDEIRRLLEKIAEKMEKATLAELRIIYKFVIGITE